MAVRPVWIVLDDSRRQLVPIKILFDLGFSLSACLSVLAGSWSHGDHTESEL